MINWIRQTKDAVLYALRVKNVNVQFSPCGNCWYTDIKPGDRWVRYRITSTAFPYFRRWSRPARFVGEGEDIPYEPPPRPDDTTALLAAEVDKVRDAYNATR